MASATTHRGQEASQALPISVLSSAGPGKIFAVALVETRPSVVVSHKVLRPQYGWDSPNYPWCGSTGIPPNRYKLVWLLALTTALVHRWRGDAPMRMTGRLRELPRVLKMMRAVDLGGGCRARRNRTRKMAEDDGMSTSLYTPDEALAEQTFLHDAFVKLRRRKWSILLTGIVLSVVLAAAIQMLPKKYHGVATVEADSPPRSRFPPRRCCAISSSATNVGSELTILKSPELLLSVIDKLNLVNDPEFNPR